ncbi:GTP binding protein [Coemansia sp. RSA 2618]|nr:GTP binding protein [Coemansia sp. RSA 2618]
MAQQLENTRIVSIKKRIMDGCDDSVVAEVRLAQKTPLPQTELRVAVLGGHGVGKSTILGCLTYDETDDGRGKARLNLMRHRHELVSGRTSSITLSTIGFDSDGHVQNYANNRSAEHIYQRSQHVVTFIDTCGHAKHLKTTARALTGYSPHAFCVVIAADAAKVTVTTREYIQIAAALNMPLMIAISKMDIADKAGFAALMHELLGTLDTVLPERSKCVVANIADHQSLADDMVGLGVVPIFTTSAVRTLGINDLTAVLGRSRAQRDTCGSDGTQSFEFHVEHLHSIDSVGSVVTGWVNSGAVAVGSAVDKQLVIGPDISGDFVEADISSIHTLRTPTDSAKPGLSASLAIQPRRPIAIQKGMVVLEADQLDLGSRQLSNEFIVAVTVLSPDLAKMQAVVVHIRSTYHLATILEIGGNGERQPRNGRVNPRVDIKLRLNGNVREYVYPGMTIVARDGRSLTFAGHITNVF